jgi:hypothetical protein
MGNFYALLTGIAMGFLIQRVRASSPAMILRNLRLENLSVIKFMAMTIAVGTIVVYAMALLVPGQMYFDIKPTYLVGVLLGAVVFGVGFGIGGYCPGTCVVGIGEGRRDAIAALLGGIVGALVFTLVYSGLIAPIVAMTDFGRITLADLIPAPLFVIALVVGLGFIAVISWLPTEIRPSRSSGKG